MRRRNQECNHCLLSHISDSVWYSNRFLNIKNRMDVFSFAHNMFVQSSVSLAWWDSLSPFTENVNIFLKNNLAAWTVTMTFKTFFSLHPFWCLASLVQLLLTNHRRNLPFSLGGIFLFKSLHSIPTSWVWNYHQLTSQPNLFLWLGTWVYSPLRHFDMYHPAHATPEPSFLHFQFTSKPSTLHVYPPLSLHFPFPSLICPSIQLKSWVNKGGRDERLGCKKERE